MWFYDPASKTSIRISAQQRLVGQASNGDVLTVNLAHDYTATLIGEETIKDGDHQDRRAWHLNLVAATSDAVYARLEYWVERDSYRAIKGKFYSDSGRLLKIAYYRKPAEVLGAMRPTETVIIDAVDANLVTTVDAAGLSRAGDARGLVPARLPAALRRGVSMSVVARHARAAVRGRGGRRAGREDGDLDRIPDLAVRPAAPSSSAPPAPPRHPRTARRARAPLPRGRAHRRHAARASGAVPAAAALPLAEPDQRRPRRRVARAPVAEADAQRPRRPDRAGAADAGGRARPRATSCARPTRAGSRARAPTSRSGASTCATASRSASIPPTSSARARWWARRRWIRRC